MLVVPVFSAPICTRTFSATAISFSSRHRRDGRDCPSANSGEIRPGERAAIFRAGSGVRGPVSTGSAHAALAFAFTHALFQNPDKPIFGKCPVLVHTHHTHHFIVNVHGPT